MKLHAALILTVLFVPFAGATAYAQAPAAGGDPSIAKARAAKDDTRVFGIPLGEPVRLPTCDPIGNLFASGGPKASPTCLIDTSTPDFIAAFLPPELTANNNDVASIELTADSCPTWLSSCTVTAWLLDGNLARVVLATKGRGVEQATAKELRGKYGPPTSSAAGIITPDVGNPFNVTDLTWALPGLRVEFQPVKRSEDDPSRVTTTEGIVTIETETAYQLRQKEVQEQSRPKL
jgi:hypothetical protein